MLVEDNVRYAMFAAWDYLGDPARDGPQLLRALRR